MTPLGGARGIVEVTVEGSGPVLETGTVSEEWRMLKELLLGPSGKKGETWASDPMMQVPSGLWAVVTTRGAGSCVDAIV